MNQTRPDQLEEILMQITNISDAKASLSKLIEKVISGEEVIIGKAGKPIAKLVPYHIDQTPRELGAGKWAGKITISDQFDDESEEINALFLGIEGDNEFTS